MSNIQIEGGRRLAGSLSVQGSKNAVLPILSATLLHAGTTVLEHVPDISDVKDTVFLLQKLGCRIKWENHRMIIDATSIADNRLSQAVVSRMRSSFLLAGAMLGRMGEVETFYPGGCVIGARPIDLHLSGFSKLGATCITEENRILLWTKGLKGNDIHLTYPSVGATENIILASVLAEGTTRIYGMAKEPEIDALIQCLCGMGADIQIHKLDDETECVVTGVRELRDSTYEIPGDRIVAGTFLAAVGSCGGEIHLNRVDAGELSGVLDALRDSGMEIEVCGDHIHAVNQNGLRNGMDLVTGPYPAFPTDLQAIFMAMLAGGKGESRIRETVFESRFRHVEQLRLLGADIMIRKDTAYITGGKRLQGGLVEAQDLRAGAALVVAGLAAEGITVVRHAEYLERGYEKAVDILQSLGANILLYP